MTTKNDDDKERRRQRTTTTTTTTTTKYKKDDDSFINDDNFLENDSNLLEDNGRTVSESRKETFVLRLHREPRGITLRTGFYHRHHRHANTCIHISTNRDRDLRHCQDNTCATDNVKPRRRKKGLKSCFTFFFKPWVFFFSQ